MMKSIIQNNGEGLSIMAAEVENELQHTKKGKAPGPDNIAFKAQAHISSK